VSRFGAAVHVLLDAHAAALEPIAAEPPDPKAKGAAKGKAEATPQARALFPADVLVCFDAADPKAAAPAAVKKGEPKADPKKGDPAEAARTGDVLSEVAAAARAAVAPWTEASFPEAAGAAPGLHPAVWLQSALTVARVERLAAKGADAKAAVRAEAEHVYAELGLWIDERAVAEVAAIDAVVATCEAAVDAAAPVAEDWRLEGPAAFVDPAARLVAPPPPPAEPALAPTDPRRLSASQLARLERALLAAAAAEGFTDGSVARSQLSAEALADVLGRLAASDCDLPEIWAEPPALDGALAALDPSDAGFVPVASVLRFFADFT
jgi:hypothetical protein